MKKYQLLLIFLIFSIVIITAGCKKVREEPVVFDNTYPQALSPDVNWALITDPYASYRLEPDWESQSVEHCRKGDILKIEGKTKKKNTGKKKTYTDWYLFEKGWLPSDCLTVYDNRYRAEKAGEIFNK